MPAPISTIETTIWAYDVEGWIRVASSRPTVTTRGADHHHGLLGQPSDQDPAGQLRRQEDRGRHGQEGDAGHQRREPLDVLEELGEEEEHPVHPGVEQAPGDVGRAAGGMGKQAQGEDRLVHPALVVHEHAQQNHADDQRTRLRSGLVQPFVPASTRPKTMPVMPSVEVTAPVRSNRPRRRGGLHDDDPTEHPDDEPDGDVHEHDPTPRDEIGEETSGDEPGGAAGRRHRRVETDGPHPRRPLGEGRGEQRQRRRVRPAPRRCPARLGRRAASIR